MAFVYHAPCAHSSISLPLKPALARRQVATPSPSRDGWKYMHVPQGACFDSISTLTVGLGSMMVIFMVHPKGLGIALAGGGSTGFCFAATVFLTFMGLLSIAFNRASAI